MLSYKVQWHKGEFKYNIGQSDWPWSVTHWGTGNKLARSDRLSLYFYILARPDI